MTDDTLQNAIVEAIVEEVVRRVREKLIQLQSKALVVCTGSKLSFPTWVSGLQRLQQQGFEFDLFLSGSAARVLDTDGLRKAVRFGEVWQDDQNAEAIVEGYATVIVPALTINTAAKLAACTPDTPVTRVVLTAMMKGKNVIVSTDGCCPDNVGRAELGYVFTPQMKEKLRANIERVRSFGATLATADTLDERVLKALGGLSIAAAKKADAPSALPAKASGGAVHTASGKVISRSAVAALPHGSTLRIPRGSQVTQLARDTAKTRGIVFIQE